MTDEKPIAERLREWNSDYISCSGKKVRRAFGLATGFDCTGMGCDTCYMQMFEDIADEIEREQKERFIELPCDSEGVPWKADEKCDFGSSLGVRTIHAMKFERNKGWSLNPVGCYGWFAAKICKRPTIVRDADGESIHVGDTCWVINGEVDATARIDITKPVKVISFDTSVSSFDVVIEYIAPNVSGTCQGYTRGVNLTHREPDSLEKWASDVNDALNHPDIDWDIAAELKRRYAALMERGE